MSGESEKTLRETFEEAKVPFKLFFFGVGVLLILLNLRPFAASGTFPVIHR